jgi:hypothetical protein
MDLVGSGTGAMTCRSFLGCVDGFPRSAATAPESRKGRDQDCTAKILYQDLRCEHMSPTSAAGWDHLLGTKAGPPSRDPLLRLRSHLGWSWLRLDTLRFSRAQLGTQLGYFEDCSAGSGGC